MHIRKEAEVLASPRCWRLTHACAGLLCWCSSSRLGSQCDGAQPHRGL